MRRTPHFLSVWRLDFTLQKRANAGIDARRFHQGFHELIDPLSHGAFAKNKVPSLRKGAR
jgi:hypothetical protein